ncbi:MAG: flap endonuclease [Cyanobacteria bacterium SZAS LIN-5]|nr:flap endonuclease [Cyanobacteria bacterium SZAS LIN-5]RTL40362.1 MAG: flap endonuclease [Candidatus Melainabacteria bacterium]
MKVHLVDGTYELFRHYFAVPHSTDATGQEIAAVRGVLSSVLSMLSKGTTHLAVATDHVIESFRNDLYPYYKTGEGIAPDLFSQFPIIEDALESMGVAVWRMVEFEADDALASGAARAAEDSRVEQVVICTPDKDLAQSVVGDRVVQLDRRREILRNEAGIIEKFGVRPASIPDFLALVGDTADGYPGIPGWGAKAAASVLLLYNHFENIPQNPDQWDKTIRNSKKLAGILFDSWDEAILYRTLATLKTDIQLFDNVDHLRWLGPKSDFEQLCTRLRSPDLFKRATALAAKKAPV